MIQTEPPTNLHVIKPQRDIVASCVDEFRKELQALITAGHVNLAIDLDGVGMIDSRGLGLFMMCQKSASDRGGRLTLVTANESFRQLFHVMRLDEHVAVVDAL